MKTGKNEDEGDGDGDDEEEDVGQSNRNNNERNEFLFLHVFREYFRNKHNSSVYKRKVLFVDMGGECAYEL